MSFKSINRVILGLHVAAMLIAAATLVWMMMIIEPTTFFFSMNPTYERVGIVRAAFTLVAILTGFWSMAARPPRQESIVLAISTVAAVALLLVG
jgi:hypothetical protein